MEVGSSSGKRTWYESCELHGMSRKVQACVFRREKRTGWAAGCGEETETNVGRPQGKLSVRSNVLVRR